jgi:phosphonate transport system ATP-binding protein
MFVQRVVGLQLGKIVYDGPPDGLSAEALTEIYGEEDWSATIRKVEDEETAPPADEDTTSPLPDRERLAGIT